MRTSSGPQVSAAVAQQLNPDLSMFFPNNMPYSIGCYVSHLQGSSILPPQVWLWTTSTSVFIGQMLNYQSSAAFVWMALIPSLLCPASKTVELLAHSKNSLKHDCSEIWRNMWPAHLFPSVLFPIFSHFQTCFIHSALISLRITFMGSHISITLSSGSTNLAKAQWRISPRASTTLLT